MFKIEFSAHSIFTVISIAAQAGFLLPKRGRSKMPSLLFLSLVRITELIMMIITYPKIMIRLLILGCVESHVQHSVNENNKYPPLLFTTSKKKFGSQVLAAPFLVRTEATSSFTTYHRWFFATYPQSHLSKVNFYHLHQMLTCCLWLVSSILNLCFQGRDLDQTN